METALMIAAIILCVLYFTWRSQLGQTIVSGGWVFWTVVNLGITDESDTFYYLNIVLLVIWVMFFCIDSWRLLNPKDTGEVKS